MSYAVGAIQTAVVSLTSGQINTLYGTPITIVGAPGTGHFIQPLLGWFQFFPGANQYGNGGALLLGYGSTFRRLPGLGDNPDADATSSYNIFSEAPYNNGVTTGLDFLKKNDQQTHNISLSLTQVAIPAAFTLTQVSNPTGVSGSSTYTGTITGGGGNAFAKYKFTITGFTNSANNGTFFCSASTATTLVLTNANAVAETHAGTATSQSALYTGTITNSADYNVSGSLQRAISFTVAGFTNSGNNGTFLGANAATGTTIVLHNAGAVNETHAATASNSIENQPLTITIGDNFPEIGTMGAIATAKIMGGHSGTGYSPGDTGDIEDGGTGTLAHYTVNTIDGGTGIATFTLNSGGCNSGGAFGYALNQGYNDTNQSGGGSGAIFVPQTVTQGNGTARIVCTYTILPI